MENRRPLQGVINILSFNRHFYLYGLAVLGAMLVAIQWLDMPAWVSILLIVAFTYGLLAPLIVSAYVYDFSGYYKFNWLDKLVPDRKGPKQIVTINAGFDETSFILQDHFPEATIRVFDFYDPKYHTEPAIVRARKVTREFPGTTVISSDAIPMENATADFVFLLSAAHEIRSGDEKVRFLSECIRICKPGGQIIMVEHLRDFPNFLAFTIGFTHFFSKHTWQQAFAKAGSRSFEETKFTPFMSIFQGSPD